MTATTTMRKLLLVLPTSILEEEMAEANAAVIAKEKSTASASALAASLLCTDMNRNKIKNMNKIKTNRKNAIHIHHQHQHQHHHRGILPKLVEEEEPEDDVENENGIDSSEEELDEENLDHDQLLQRARSRLLEDLSESKLTGEKGVLTLPHSLRKYKEVYNKNGRIGIYTPAERAAIIARFQSKRTRRVWNKKIRYNCRKNLADRRLRVKGRFVKRAIGSAATATPSVTMTATVTTTAFAPSIPEDAEGDNDNFNDTEMPDVSDPDAGFCPTDDQPYRRLRRHTIT